MARGRQRAPVIPDGDDVDPDASDYTPKQVLADTEATKDILLFLRKEGITAQTITIGSVQLVGVIDHFPRKGVQEQLEKLAGGGQARRSAGDALDEFATDEERRILVGDETD